MKTKFKEFYQSMDKDDSSCFWSGYFFVCTGLICLACFALDWHRGSFLVGPLVIGLALIAYGLTCALIAFNHGHELHDQNHEHDNDH